MTFEMMVTEWIEHCTIQRGQRTGGVQSYSRVVISFFDWVKGKGFSGDPRKIGRDHVTEWQKDLFYTFKNVSNATRASKLSALRSFFGYLRYAGYLSVDPTKGVPSPKIQPHLAQKFSTEELRLLFSAPDRSTSMGVRDLAILKILYAAGPRVSELVNMDLQHIQDTGGYIRLQIINGKGGKSRTVTVRTKPSQTLREWLVIRSAIEADTDAIFVGLRGKARRLTTRSIANVLNKYADLVGIASAEVFCHKLRSTFATDLYDSAHEKCPRCGQQIQYVGIVELAALMGHEDVKTTMGYIAISDRVLRKTAIPDKRFNEIEED